jgi:hypothetical protein
MIKIVDDMFRLLVFLPATASSPESWGLKVREPWKIHGG